MSEVGLWRAVIHQAITDASQPLSANKRTRLDQQRARDWFRSADSYFRRVCELADIDPDTTRKHALKLIKEASRNDATAPQRRQRSQTVSRQTGMTP
jgi:hypothetical protein